MECCFFSPLPHGLSSCQLPVAPSPAPGPSFGFDKPRIKSIRVRNGDEKRLILLPPVHPWLIALFLSTACNVMILYSVNNIAKKSNNNLPLSEIVWRCNQDKTIPVIRTFVHTVNSKVFYKWSATFNAWQELSSFSVRNQKVNINSLSELMPFTKPSREQQQRVYTSNSIWN